MEGALTLFVCLFLEDRSLLSLPQFNDSKSGEGGGASSKLMRRGASGTSGRRGKGESAAKKRGIKRVGLS